MLGVVLVFRDISKRREQEIQIDKWQRIFQQAGFGVAILVNDGKTILEVNGAFARMHGYEPDELRGQSLRGTGGRRNRATRKRAKGHEDHAIYESVHKRKDGRFVSRGDRYDRFRNAAGEPLFRAAYFADISDRKTARN